MGSLPKPEKDPGNPPSFHGPETLRGLPTQTSQTRNCSVQAVGVVPSGLRRADVCLANDLVAEIPHSSSLSLAQGYADVLTSCSQREGMEMP